VVKKTIVHLSHFSSVISWSLFRDASCDFVDRLLRREMKNHQQNHTNEHKQEAANGEWQMMTDEKWKMELNESLDETI
jgi:hypothetical protein